MIDSWAKYKEWISQTVIGGAHYYFRGQRKFQWKLQSTFHRYSEKTGISLIDYLDHVIPEVCYYISAYENEIIDLSNELQFGTLLAKLQHHGFPTPLIDWTLSPYIAAYFAFKDVDPHNPDTDAVAIHMFAMNDWSSTFQQPFNLRDHIKFVSVFRPYAKGNPRMIQQMATTTATNVSDMGEHVLQRSNESGKTYLYFATLPVSERRLVMNELNLMGINSMTMFPGYDGICSSMKELFFNNLDVTPLAPPPPPIPPLLGDNS